MSVDLTKTFYGRVDAQVIATGSTVAEEGSVLVALLEDGVEKVKPSAASAGVFAGFAVFRQQTHATRPVGEDVVVPSTAAYTVQLDHTNLISGQIRVRGVVSGTDLTVVAIAPNTGEVQVNYTTGLLTFHSAQAGLAYTVLYRYNLTVAEAQSLYYQAPVNYPDPNNFMSVGVGKGKSRVFTTYYDQSIDWSGTVTIKGGAAGILTSGGSGPTVPGARVVQVPTVAVPVLGIEFIG